MGKFTEDLIRIADIPDIGSSTCTPGRNQVIIAGTKIVSTSQVGRYPPLTTRSRR